MSKFLKFIVHFIVICTILCVVALAVPPFLGVTTEIMDDSSAETNLALGSVTYAIPEKAEEVSTGTPILVQGESGVFRYNIVSLDLENHTGVVIDANGSETVNVAIKNRVPKIVITIPYLGYLLIATESVEGLIILGLAVLFLIILYVIAELWKKDAEEDYDDEEEEDTSYIKSAKELKREEKERERRMRDEDRQLLKNEKNRKKEEKKKRKIIKTGGFVDEVYEDELEDEEPPRRRANVQSATSEAHELLKKEIAAATAEEAEKPEKPAPKKTRKAAPPAQEKPRKSAKPKKQPPVKEEVPPAEVKKMAIPIRSAAQLADMAKQEGDAPDIVRDGITKVTLFDYSDIIGEFDEEEE